MKKKAIVLLSGGMDSAVTLYIAKETYECSALIFNYGQRAQKELEYAVKLAEKASCEVQVLDIELPWKGSALLDKNISIPSGEMSQGKDIPDTYVPARNLIFLSYGVSFAEAKNAEAVFIGAHQLDYSNYPDCRSEFFDEFQKTVDKGTKGGVQDASVKVVTPILNNTKKEIIEIGNDLRVPFELTWSCYQEGAVPCLRCESCIFRMKAFEEAQIEDPLLAHEG